MPPLISVYTYFSSLVSLTNLGEDTYIDVAAEADCIFDFRDPLFHLEESNIPDISIDFSTPIEFINNKLKCFHKNLNGIHINAQSIPKHYDEIVRLLIETKIDFLAISETFVCDKTPKMF